MADKIILKNGNQAASVYSSSKVDSLKSDTDSKISSINSKLSTMGTADNISALDNRLKSVEGNYAKKSDIPTSLPASDVSAWAKASSKPSYSWSEISNKPTNFITSGNIGSQTVSKAGTLIDNSNAGWNVAASWMHSSKSSVGLNDYISVMEATGSNTALIYTAQAKNVKVGSAASADSAGSANTASMISGFGTRNDNTGWGKLTAKNGYTIRFGSDQPGGGGTVFAEKDGKTYMQIDGTLFVNEGNKEVAVKSDIPTALPDVHGLHMGDKYFNGSATTTIYASDLNAPTSSYFQDSDKQWRMTISFGGCTLTVVKVYCYPLTPNHEKNVSFVNSPFGDSYPTLCGGTSGLGPIVVNHVSSSGFTVEVDSSAHDYVGCDVMFIGINKG